MTVMEAILSRRSIRKYDSRPIEQEKLDKVTEAFRQSPSAGNGQNWKLYVVKTQELREKIRKVCMREPSFVTEAPVMLIFCGTNQTVMTNSQRLDSVDVSIGTTMAILAAWEQGLGTCWMASYKQDDMQSALGLPDGTSIVAITPLGYPAESPDAKPRKDAQEVIVYL